MDENSLSPAEGAAASNPMSDISSLTNACCSGDKERVKELLGRSVPVNCADSLGLTPLQRAVRNGFIDIVDMLLVNGADPNVVNESHETALHFAASYGYTQIIGLLLQFGADPNSRDIDGRTPLHVSVLEGFLEGVQQLVLYGANPCATDEKGLTALHLAASSGHLKIAQHLLKPRESHPTTHYCRTDSGQVAKLESITKMMLQQCNSKLVNAADYKGRTALHLAVWRNATLTEFLLQSGANPNTMDNNNYSVFHVACMEQNKSSALTLLTYGASPLTASRDGRTPMHVLCTDMLIFLSRWQGFQNIVLNPQKLGVLHIMKVLMTYPLHIDVPDREGFTAFGLWQEVYAKRETLFPAYFASINAINSRMQELFFFNLKCVAGRAAVKYKLFYKDPEILHKHLGDLIEKHDKYAIER